MQGMHRVATAEWGWRRKAIRQQPSGRNDWARSGCGERAGGNNLRVQNLPHARTWLRLARGARFPRLTSCIGDTCSKNNSRLLGLRFESRTKPLRDGGRGASQPGWRNRRADQITWGRCASARKSLHGDHSREDIGTDRHPPPPPPHPPKAPSAAPGRCTDPPGSTQHGVCGASWDRGWSTNDKSVRGGHRLASGVATGPPESAPIYWVARGSYAAACRRAAPLAAGIRVPLGHYRQLASPLNARQRFTGGKGPAPRDPAHASERVLMGQADLIPVGFLPRSACALSELSSQR